MKKRFISFILAVVLIASAVPTFAMAATDEIVITYEDGSYLVVTVNESATRSGTTKTGKKTYSYYDANDNLEWKAVLSATFTYTGSTSTCTNATCTTTVYNSNWYEYSKSTTRNGGTATTNLVMGRKLLGVTVSKFSRTLTLTCDSNGNLS